jgi:Asp-tRNA(Asn)/Glu-tRNA(Gln) amidotransferase A subunit family amidase
LDDELSWASAHHLRSLIGARQLSPVELLEHCLARIEVLEPSLHAFITVAAERAMDQARRAEDAVARGEELGPLHGVPVAVKDEVWTEGIASSGGSMVFGRFVPGRDGTVAERLRGAGAVIVGKTSLPEFAVWPRSKHRLGGESVNPWDARRISGASSGGSAASVSAGLVPLAVGSDGGGSIRIPSAICGTTGLFPTPGRIPSYGSFSYSLGGSLGPIARDVRDVALLQQVLAGPDARDAGALTTAPPDVLGGLDDGMTGLRVGWSLDLGHLQPRPEVARLVEQAIAVLGGLGARSEAFADRIDHPWGADMRGALMQLQAVVAAQDWVLDDDPAAIPELVDEDWMWAVFGTDTPFTASPGFLELCVRHQQLLAPNGQLSVGMGLPQLDAAELARQAALRTQFLGLFDRYDVICTPTMTDVAPIAPDGWASPYPDDLMGTGFTFIANHAGCPAATIPCGFVDGLPVGLQVIGRPGDEATVLRTIRAYEGARPFGPESLRPPLDGA